MSGELLTKLPVGFREIIGRSVDLQTWSVADHR